MLVPAHQEAELTDTFTLPELSASTTLLELLGQGVDKYALDDGAGELSVVAAFDLLRHSYPREMLIKSPSMTADGRPIFLSSVISDAVEIQHNGRGDDIENGLRLVGPMLKLTDLTTAEEHSLAWQYLEFVDIIDRGTRYVGALAGDYINYDIFAPASPATSNPGAGGYDKIPIGPELNLFAPNSETLGDWDLNLSEKLNANVNITKVTPIPAGGNGFFDFDLPTGVVSLNANQTGEYHLFDADYLLSRFLNAVPIYGSDKNNFVVPASYSGKRLLPHWKHKVIIKKATATGSLSCWWWVVFGRENTRLL